MKLALLWISRLSALPALGIGMRKHNSVLWLYALVSFVSDIGSMLLKNNGMGNGWLANLFILSEFILVSLMFKRLFKNNRVFYTWVATLSLSFIIYTLERPFLLLSPEQKVVFDSLGNPQIFYNRLKAIQTANMLGAGFFLLIYIVYGLCGLYAVLKKQKVIFIERFWFFWVCCAFIVYASGCFPIFLFKDEMIKLSVKNYMSIWEPSFYLFNTAKNLLIALAIHHQIKHKSIEFI